MVEVNASVTCYKGLEILDIRTLQTMNMIVGHPEMSML